MKPTLICDVVDWRRYAARFAATACSLGIALAVQAASLDDPFDTAALSRPPAGLASREDGMLQPCPALPSDPLSLADLVNAALCANPRTREVWANVRVETALVGAARAAYMPTLNGIATIGRESDRGGTRPTPLTANQRSATLSLSWLIYDFGGRDAAHENARQLLDAASASQDAAVQSLFLSAVQAYYQLQATQAAREAATEAERAAQESVNAADARYRAGAATPADKLQAQTAWSQAKLNRIKAEGDLVGAQGGLASVVGLPANTPLRIAQVADAERPASEMENFSSGIAGLIDDALQRRPDLRAAQAQVQAARSAVDVARASGRPTIALGISGSDVHTGGLPDAHSSTLGVTLNIPLFTGFDTTYRVRAAEAQVDASAAQRDQLRLQVALDVWNNYQALTTATQSVRTTADLLASAEQAQRVALGRYKAGMGSILDVLNAQSALAGARLQRVQATYSWNVARVSLAQAMGTLDRAQINSLDERPAP